MIISFHHKFIFFAVPKTGSQSIRHAIRPHLHQHDWEQSLIFEQCKFPIADIARLHHGHIAFTQLLTAVPRFVIEEFTKFSFVRHPVDRFISYCYFVNYDNGKMRHKPLETMKTTFQKGVKMKNVLMKPQYHFISNKEGTGMMDFIGKFESLSSDFESLVKLLKIPQTSLKPMNLSGRPAEDIIFDSELTEMLYEYYEKDFEMFNYSTQV